MTIPKATDVMVELIHSAQCAGITARYVLFASWFTAPRTTLALKDQENQGTIAMMKKSKTKYALLAQFVNLCYSIKGMMWEKIFTGIGNCETSTKFASGRQGNLKK